MQNLNVLFLLPSLFYQVARISKMTLKGYFTSVQNHWGNKVKTKFSLYSNPLMMQWLFQRFLSIIVGIHSIGKL